MEREVGGGIGMGNTCKPMAVSFQCMTKFTTNKKKKKKGKKKNNFFLLGEAPHQVLYRSFTQISEQICGFKSVIIHLKGDA